MGVDDLLQEFGGMEGLPDANAEHGRLRAIVDDTSAALIDVSRVGNDDFILGGAHVLTGMRSVGCYCVSNLRLPRAPWNIADPDATKTQRLTVLREATVRVWPSFTVSFNNSCVKMLFAVHETFARNSFSSCRRNWQLQAVQ